MQNKVSTPAKKKGILSSGMEKQTLLLVKKTQSNMYA